MENEEVENILKVFLKYIIPFCFMVFMMSVLVFTILNIFNDNHFNFILFVKEYKIFSSIILIISIVITIIINDVNPLGKLTTQYLKGNGFKNPNTNHNDEFSSITEFGLIEIVNKSGVINYDNYRSDQEIANIKQFYETDYARVKRGEKGVIYLQFENKLDNLDKYLLIAKEEDIKNGNTE